MAAALGILVFAHVLSQSASHRPEQNEEGRLVRAHSLGPNARSADDGEGVGSEDTHTVRSTPWGRGFPSLATWNAGGGGPSAEFFGSNWDNDPTDKTKSAVRAKIEQSVGYSVLRTAGIDPDGQFSKWLDLPGATEEFKGQLNFSGETANKFLSGFENAVLPFNVAAALSVRKKSVLDCWNKLDMKVILSHALGKGKWDGSLSCLFKDPADYKARLGSTFSSADGCFNNRKTYPILGADFFQLVEAASSDAAYWSMWIGFVFNSKWGPPKFCEQGNPNLAVQDFPDPLFNDPKTDLVAVALFDRFLVEIAKRVVEASTVPIAQATSLAINPMLEADKANSLSRIAKELLVGKSDIIFVQEVSEPLVGALPKYDAVGTVLKEGAMEDSAIFVQKNEQGESMVDNERTKSVQKTWADMIEQQKKGSRRHHPPDKKVQKFYSDLMKYSLAVTVDNIILLSVHSDSDGFFCEEILALVAELGKQCQPAARIFVGMDSNVQLPKVKTASTQVTLMAAAKRLGFKTYVTPTTQSYSVNKKRGFLQPQFKKAGKHDQTMKDWLFYLPPFENNDIRSAITTGLLNASVMNTPTGEFVEGELFPKQAFPADHFIVASQRLPLIQLG